MADIAELGFKVDSQPLAKANDELEKLPPRAGKAEQATERFNREVEKTDSAVKRAAGGISTLTSVVMKLAAGAAAYFSVTGLVAYADAWSDMQSRVGAAIKDMDAAPAMMQRIVDIANASYSPLAQTAEIYGRNVSVLKAMGLGAAEAADYTESLNHMLVITATRGERAESVQNALSKAMALGKLTGEGLETVLANGGRVAEALATELGTTVNGLRQMATDGKITSAVIAQALLKSLEDVRVEAGEMTATIGDAFVIMNNNITAAIGQFDKAYGISATLATGIIFLAENLDLVAAGASGIATVMAVALTPALIAATAAAWGFTAALLANPMTYVAIAIGLVVARVVLLIQRMGGLGEAFQTVQNIASDTWERIKAGGQSLVAVLAGTAMRIKASFLGAFVEIDAAFANMVAGWGAAGEWAGFNAGEMQANVAATRLEIEELNAAADKSFADAATFWDRAMSGSRMDPVGMGSNWNDFNNVFNETAEAAGDVAINMGSVATAAGAANDNAKTLADDGMDALKEAAKAGREEFDFYKQTFSGFFQTFRNDLMNGASFWDAFRNAATRALDSIANRLLDMATNGLFDMLFGGFTSILGGAAIPMGGFIPGLTGPKLFASGGYTGNGPTGAAAGIVHGQEFVVNAAATRAIGVGNLQALNDNHVLPSAGGGGFQYNDNRQYDFSGSAMTRQEIEALMAKDRADLLDALPDAIEGYQNDPRKRVIKAA